jgi:DNA-binding CsgD family transcriptional regulator
MTSLPLTHCEREAVLYLTEYEVIKVAADKRNVSEHTQKNQVKSAMQKLGVCTQVGLIKEFFRLIYGARFDIRDARQMLAVFMLTLIMYSLSNTNNTYVRRISRGRRSGIELIAPPPCW